MLPGGQGTDINAGLILFSCTKTGYLSTVFNYSLDLCPFPGLHVIHILGNLAGMVATPFEIAGDKDIMGAAGDAPGVFHHVGNCFAEDRAP